MPYDPSVDEFRRVRDELHQLRLDHIKEVSDRTRDTIDLRHWLGLGAIFGIAAIYWIGFAIFIVYQRLSESCGCG